MGQGPAGNKKGGKNKYPQLGELRSCGGEAAPPGPVKCQRGEENPGFSPKNGKEKEGRSRTTGGTGTSGLGGVSGESQKIQALRNADFGKGGSFNSERIWPQTQKNSRGSGKGPKFNWDTTGRGREQLPAPGTELGGRSKGNPSPFRTQSTSRGAGPAPIQPKTSSKKADPALIQPKISSKGGDLTPFTQNPFQRGRPCPNSIQSQFQEGRSHPFQPKINSKGTDPAPFNPESIPKGQTLPNSTQSQFQEGRPSPIPTPHSVPGRVPPWNPLPKPSSTVDAAPSQPQTPIPS